MSILQFDLSYIEILASSFVAISIYFVFEFGFSSQKKIQAYYNRTKNTEKSNNHAVFSMKRYLNKIRFINKNIHKYFAASPGDGLKSSFNIGSSSKILGSLFVIFLIVLLAQNGLGFSVHYVLASALGIYYLQKSCSKKTRKRALSEDFADVLDLLAICIEAGHSIDVSIKKVSEQIDFSNTILSQELIKTFAEINCLPDRYQAFFNLANRTNLDCYRRLSTAMVQSEKFGNPVVEIIQQHANEYRQFQMIEIEKKAARIPVLLTIPLVCLVLPSLFIIILSPSIIQLNFTIK